MPIAPTRFSRVSIGWVSSTQSIEDKFVGDTGENFSVVGGATFTRSTVSMGGNATVSGTLRVTGAITAVSTATFGDNVTATGGLLVGNAAAINELVAISSATAAVSLGAIAGNESSSVQTVALSGATRGDSIFITLDPIYALVAANRDVAWFASSSSTAGEVHVWGINSTITSVTPTASTVIRLTRINHPSYI